MSPGCFSGAEFISQVINFNLNLCECRSIPLFPFLSTDSAGRLRLTQNEGEKVLMGFVFIPVGVSQSCSVGH